MRFNYEEFSFLLPEDNSHNRSQREKIAQIFYESLNIKNLFFSKNAVLSCFATGRSTALVLDSGAYLTEATTVHDGYALIKTSKKCQYGGETLTQELGNYLEKDLGVNLNYRNATYESANQYHKKLLLRNIKEYVFKSD
jgi:actin-related protein